MDDNKTIGYKQKVWEKYPEVFIKEIIINESSQISILIGGFEDSCPKSFMDNIVKIYVGKDLMYNEFIETYLDNPWVRIIIFGFNDINIKNAIDKEFKNVYKVTCVNNEIIFNTFDEALKYITDNVKDEDVRIEKVKQYIS